MKSKKFSIINSQLSIILLMVVLFNQPIKAQVTIGSQNAPDGNALLDLRQNTADSLSTKGLLLPRVALTSTTSFTPLTAHVKGMTVYNTATAGDVTPGIYYNDGSKWVPAGSVLLPDFQTAQVDYATKLRSFGTGNNSTAMANAHNVDTTGITLTLNNIQGFAVNNTTTGFLTVPAGTYIISITGDISGSEYAYAMLKNASNNSAILTTICSEREQSLLLLNLTETTQMYFAIGGISSYTLATDGVTKIWGENPSPQYYLNADQYNNGRNSNFKLIFMKYS